MKILLILGALIAASWPIESSAQVMLQRAVVASGGNTSSNGSVQVGSTAGQPVVGVASNSQMIGYFGFWTPGSAAAAVSPLAPEPALDLTAWPNPASGATKVTVSMAASADLDIRIFDVTGKEVRTVYVGPASGKRDINVDLSELPQGSYIVAARIPGQLVEQRISIVR